MKRASSRRAAVYSSLAFAGVSSVSPAHAEVRALLVGVSHFQSPVISDLQGPNNDLVAMEALVRRERATDVTVLHDEDVTRTTVETALHELGMRAKPGDWIVFYYSGHGALAEAVIKGTRDGDFDQFVPLPKFDPDDQDAERFITDKDFYAWLARYIPPAAQILMIADTCHSGTLHRSADQRAFQFTPRLALSGASSTFQLVARPGPRFPAILAAGNARSNLLDSIMPVGRPDLPNLIYIAAAQDDQLALEASSPGAGAPSRGILTYSFEQGLTSLSADGKVLAADFDRDGAISVSEIAVYVDSQVRALTGQRQEPKTSYLSGRENAHLFASTIGAALRSTGERRALPRIFAPDPHGRSILAGADPPWAVAAELAGADFIWDYASGAVLRRSGDTVATAIMGSEELRSVVEKWNAIEELRPFLNEGAAKVTVGPERNGSRYAAGETVMVSLRHDMIGKAASPFATVFNLSSDGTVQLLFPTAPTDGEGKLGLDGTLALLESSVVPPFGVDHVIAIISEKNPAPLRAMLRTLDRQRAAGRTVQPIMKLLAADNASLSIAELYTGN